MSEKQNKVYQGSDYLKFIAEGAKSFDEVIKCLEDEISYLHKLRNFWLTLQEPVDNGHLFWEIPGNIVNNYCKHFKCKKEDLYCLDEEEE
jgi:hypothetical protein